MMNVLPVKIGETFQMELAFANDDGTPFDLMGCSILAQVRDLLGNLVDTLAVLVWLDTPNVAQISEPTDWWPAGTLLLDMVVRDLGTGIVTYSDTIQIRASAPISLGVVV